LKKALELSVLCDVKVAIVIVDKHEKVTVCSSMKNVDGFIDKYLKNLKDGTKEMIFTSNVTEIFYF
jgi:hypothetical protein